MQSGQPVLFLVQWSFERRFQLLRLRSSRVFQKIFWNEGYRLAVVADDGRFLFLSLSPFLASRVSSFYDLDLLAYEVEMVAMLKDQ